jgi:biofilm protein TabA
MLVTDLDAFERQAPMGPQFRRAVEFLRRKDLLDLPDGEVPLDGKRVYAILQRYTTARLDAPKFEYHRKYIDIQYVLAGEEIIGWAPAAAMAVSVEYHADRDICFGSVGKGEWSPVRLAAGQLAVFWPEDGHAPRLAAEAPALVRKIVVKIAV